jgi:hypothetical protein
MISRSIFYFCIACIAFFIACNTEVKQNSASASDSTAQAVADSSASCVNPSKYPNNDKPMALMMRQMADNAGQMKDIISKGEVVNGAQFPFIRFHLVEPTDPDVLQPQFFENARLFQEAHKALINAPKEKQKEMYNAYIGKCITCHESYCSGPLKRIRKLSID